MFKKQQQKYKSPIDKKPLRRPGQSIEEKLDKIFDDDFLKYALPFGVFVGVLIWEWYRYFFNLKYHPIIVTLTALLVCGYCFYKLFKLRDQIRAYKQGLDGERFMGDYLDCLKEKGCKVLHDFVGQYGNIDHIVINRFGIFTIETKTMSKDIENTEKNNLAYDGNELKFKDGRPLKKSPINQAQAQAKMLKDFIAKNMGEHFWAQPVVVYPRWFISPCTDRGNKDTHKVWVCNQDYLDGLLNNGQGRLTEQQVNVIYNKLADYIRNYEPSDKKS